MRSLLRPGILGMMLPAAALLALTCASAARAAERIALRPNLPPGTSWTFDSSGTMEGQNKITSNGQTQQYTTKFTSRRSGKVEVLSAADGVPTSLRITFDENSENTSTTTAGAAAGAQTQKFAFPYAGKTVTITRGAGGTVTDDFKGEADPQIVAELHTMLAQGQSIVPRQPVTVGDEWKAEPKLLAEAMELKGADDHAEMTIRLLELATENGKPVARVKVSTTVQRSINGMNSLAVMEGTAVVDVASGHTIRSDVKGPIEAKGDQQSAVAAGGQAVTYHIESSGTMTARNSAPLVSIGRARVAPATRSTAPAKPGAAAAAPQIRAAE
jgi:hypothetical protein